WEWTSSACNSYPCVATDGRERAESTANRVLRGGSWFVVAWFARAACRVRNEPGFAIDSYGFRLARSVPTSYPFCGGSAPRLVALRPGRGPLYTRRCKEVAHVRGHRPASADGDGSPHPAHSTWRSR